VHVTKPYNPALVLRPSYVPEKVGINKKKVNKKLCSHEK